ncbi:MAG: 1-(5-phosphoribosyl)-5-[(5-phosphoribosylamino)methylideneamino]imidazole-4-carboxamide isomerase [Clostridiales bacterium]|nr:1-(5-phosphoribosyl)-5-[(5-phosphoribosylamino)methylideneamino]imidazole-4-carboxamide isomerase [Clostridiales bacterium]
MKIFPAIDIIEGKVVRLCKGDYSSAKNYALTPLEAAKKFCASGATNLHVVDLDGAKSGMADNAKIIEEIVSKCGMFVEVGGGIRTFEQIKRYLDCGVGRVILGTIAIRDFDFVKRAVAEFGKAVCVGVDVLNGKVAINGWKEITETDSLQFCRDLKHIGVDNVIYTDISKDGMLSGTNLEVYTVLCQTEYPEITASGGITSLEELEKLKKSGVYGAILGKALYEDKIDLASAIKLSEE